MRELNISYGNNRQAKRWVNKTIRFEDLKKRLKVTIRTTECASDTTEPYAFNDVVYQKLITLCVDICKRNGKKKLLWLGDKEKTLNYEPNSDEMVLTVHRWFVNKSCPGKWMYARMGDLAEKVTTQLGGVTQGETSTGHPEKLTSGYYRVRKTWSDSKSQKAHTRSSPTPRSRRRQSGI